MPTYKYIFWSVNIQLRDGEWVWFCIPPDEKYLPKAGEHNMRGDYPIAAVRKHEEDILPPPSYWLEPHYESIVFNDRMVCA